MSATADVARMLTLVPWLLERPGASLGEVAEAFGVDVRTVRRDLSHLDFCGLPGLGGGDLFDVAIVGDRILVSMADELRRPLRLTPREALRLVLTLTAVEQALGDELPALRSAIDKVRKAANLPRGPALTVDPAPGRWVDVVRRALARQRRLRLTYQGRSDDAPRERLVDPWQLDATSDGWYLHAYDTEALDHRSFRLDRIAAVEVLDEAIAVGRPDEPLPPPIYQPGDGAIEIELLLDDRSRWLGDAVACDVDEETGSRRRIVFATDAPGWVARLVLMASPGVEIVRPTNLAATVRDLAAAALVRYRPDQD